MIRVRSFWAAVLFAAAVPSGAAAEEAPVNPPQLTMSEINSFREQVTPCWNVRDIIRHPGVTGEAQAQIRILLERDGSINKVEALPVPAHITNESERDFHTLLNESALHAVEACAPYILPPDKYDNWRQMTLNFNLAPITTPPVVRARESGTLSEYDRKRIFGY